MTAEEVRGVVFQKAAIGGYKQSDVDLFLDEVAVCIETMTAKIRALEKAKFDSNKSGSPVAEASKPIVVPKPVEVKPVTAVAEEKTEPKPEQKSEAGISDYGIQSLLLRAQRLAEQIEAEAKQASEELLTKSADDAKDIISRADGEAEDTIEKANAILAEAERKEESINAAARAEAENIINEAVARSGQMLTATREKLKSEQEMCDKLRTEFSQVRNVIVGFYEEQLRELKTVELESVKKEENAVSPVEAEVAEPVEVALEAEEENTIDADADAAKDISSFSNSEPKTAEIKLDL